MATEKATGAPAAQLGTSEAGINHDTVGNGIRLAGEFFIPGASLLLDGKVGPGALHAVAGLVGKALLGPPAWILVAANSYSQSCSNKSLVQQFRRSPSSEEAG